MRFDPPLLHGKLLRRYQRFFADVALPDGSTVTAHCANSGSMRGVAVAGCEVALSHQGAPGRRLRHTWELIRLGRSWVGVNTARPNALVAAAVARGRVPELAGYPSLRREVPYGRASRIDLQLSAPDRPPCLVEVKSVTMAAGREARFPDAVTERGQKHLRELRAAVGRGQRAVLFYWVFRGDCAAVAPADDIDPEYGRLLRAAAAGGVELLAYRARVSPRGVWIGEPVPVRL